MNNSYKEKTYELINLIHSKKSLNSMKHFFAQLCALEQLDVFPIVNAIGEFYVDSWYTSHVHGIKYQKFQTEYLFRMTVCWRVYKMTMFLIQIHIAMSQFDLWLIALAFDIIAYTILTVREEKTHDENSFTYQEIKQLKRLCLCKFGN